MVIRWMTYDEKNAAIFENSIGLFPPKTTIIIKNRRSKNFLQTIFGNLIVGEVPRCSSVLSCVSLLLS